MDDTATNLILERLNRIGRDVSNLRSEMDGMRDQMRVIDRRLEEVVEVAHGAIGWAGYAMTSHEVPARRLEDYETRLKKVEETTE